MLAFVALFMMGIPAAICFISANGIVKGAGWAWFTSLAIGLLATLFGVSIVSIGFFPDGVRELGVAFCLGFGSLFLVPGLTGLVLLNLPQTREFVFRREKTNA